MRINFVFRKTKAAMWQNGSLKTSWLALWNLSVGWQLLQATPLPQNPFEAISVGAMTIAGSAAEIIQNGAALHKEGGFETPFLKMNSKTAVGMGQALRTESDSDEDSDEDDRRRRKRSAAAELLDMLQLTAVTDPLQHPHLHRGKRSPCHTGSGGGGTGSGGTGSGGTGSGGTGAAPPDYPMDYDEAVERKRRQRKAARKRSAQKKSGKKARSKTKKLTDDGSSDDRRRRRRRRQVEVDLTPTVDGAGKKISDYAKQFTEKVRGVWESVVSSVQSAMQHVKQTIKGSGANGTQGGADMKPPADVEYI